MESTIVGGKRRRVYRVICECGKEFKSPVDIIIRGLKKSCGCQHYPSGNMNPKWGGHGEISGNYWDHVKRSASKRDFELSITIEEAWQLFLKQERKCKLSGVELTFGGARGRGKTASLDRIDSQIGYTYSNCQWVHKDVNRMKQHFDEVKFIELCKTIASYNKDVQ